MLYIVRKGTVGFASSQDKSVCKQITLSADRTFAICVTFPEGDRATLRDPQFSTWMLTVHMKDVEEVRKCEHCHGQGHYKSHGVCWACRGKRWQSAEDIKRHAKYKGVRQPKPEVTVSAKEQAAEDAALDPTNHPLYFMGSCMQPLPKSIHRQKAPEGLAV